jgi:4-amino-4-deoxy-L-arabinose transferase-like glycosyltransferase
MTSPFPFAAGGPADALEPQRARRWIAAILALGIAARLFRAVLAFPLWSDEAFLSASFLERGYVDMFRPLEYHQVSPLGFLWAQLTAVKLLGFTEFTLRLVPMLASVASLLLFARLAARTLSGAARLLAVAVFAFSYSGLRYANEAKPYGFDVLVVVVLLLLAVEWLRRPERQRWPWLLTAFAPVAIGCSFPAVFVAGGISLATLWELVRRPRLRVAWRAWTAWLAFNLSVAASFLGAYWLYVRAQSAAELSAQMQPYWRESFPPLDSVGRLAGWLFWTHTGDMFAHPVGGPRMASIGTTLVCLVTLIVLWRSRRWSVILLGLAPLALNLIVAAAGRYPYGGHVRIALYLMPLVCLAAGLGLATVLAWFARRRPERAAWVPAVLVLLALLPIGSAVRDVLTRGKTPSDIRTRDFARWFWNELDRQGEVVCLKSDWHRDLAPPAFEYRYSSLYWCNQRIYSPRHRRGDPPRLERVTDQRPLQCVVYHSQANPLDAKAVAGWLAEMEPRWRLADRRQYQITHTDRRERTIEDVSKIDVFRFAPR